MSRNITFDKLYKVDKKSSKKSTSVDCQQNEITSMKTSYDLNCSSTKNYNKKSIDFTESDINQKKFSSRISNSKKNSIPIKNKTIVDANNDRDHSLGSIYKSFNHINTANGSGNMKCSPTIVNSDVRYISPLTKNKHITYETILREIFDNLDNFDSSDKNYNNVSDKYSNLLGILDKLKSNECKLGRSLDRIDFFDKIWKKFMTVTINNFENIEKEERSLRNRFNEQVDKLVNLHSSFEKERNRAVNQESHYKAEIEYFKRNLNEKEKQIQETSIELNKVLAVKEKCDSNEIYLYSQKQLLRDNKVLISENKQLRECLVKLEKDLESLKIKEMKMMKILFTLSRKGIAINEIVDKELTAEYKKSKTLSDKISPEKERETSETLSVNDSIYTPIYIEPARIVKKPEKVPCLDLYNINSSTLNFNSEETINKGKLNNSSNIKTHSTHTDPNLSEIKDDSFSDKYLTENMSSPKIKESSYYPAQYLNAMEKELLKTYKSINKEKNMISNKSTSNNTESNFDLQTYSKKNSLNDSIKVGTVEIKDSINISEQDFEKLSIHLNSSHNKNQNNNHTNLKDKLLSSKKAGISSLFNSNNYNRNSSKIKVKSKCEDFNKITQFHSSYANDERVVNDKKVTSSHDIQSDILGKKMESVKDQRIKKIDKLI